MSLFIPLLNTELKSKIRYLKTKLLIILIGALVTSSAHIISFLFSTIIFIFIDKKILANINELKIDKSLINKIILGLFLFGLFVAIVNYDVNLRYRFDSLIENLNPSSILTSETLRNSRNLSILSWLNSADKALYVFNLSPIIGLGPGSTGHFPFISRFYKELLIATNGSEINRFDGYSLLFRGTIEYGVLFLTIILLNFWRYFYRFNNCIVEERDYC